MKTRTKKAPKVVESITVPRWLWDSMRAELAKHRTPRRYVFKGQS